MSNENTTTPELQRPAPLPPVTGSAHVIGGNRLACMIANCHQLLRHKYRKTPLWAMVSDITGHGSTYSVEICLQAGYDPNQNCGLAKLKASAQND